MKKDIEGRSGYSEAANDWILQEDFELIANGRLDFNDFRNQTFLISGATGLIGSLLVKTLLCCNRIHNLQLKVIAVVRNIEKAKKVFCSCLGSEALTFCVANLEKDNLDISDNVDYIVHAASITSSKLMVSNPVETIKTALFGTNTLLELAKLKKVKAMIYISSMEAYGQFQQKKVCVNEENLGYLDLSSVRTCYPESKRMSEVLCNAYASEYKINVMSARLAQTFGAGVSLEENRIFAQMSKSVINEKNIVLHTTGESDGNYCYSRDALTAILLLLTKGRRGEVYNISNEATNMTIKDMAMMVAEKIAYDKIQVVFELDSDSNLGYAPDTKIKLNSSKLRQLGWKPEVDLEEAYRRMIGSMKIQMGIDEDRNG